MNGDDYHPEDVVDRSLAEHCEVLIRQWREPGGSDEIQWTRRRTADQLESAVRTARMFERSTR